MLFVYPNVISEMRKRGMNCKDLADLLGITYHSAYRRLRGRVGWRLHETIRLCQYFEVSDAAWLFALYDKNTTKFSDVSGWSVPYVAFASDNGIVNGVTDSLFSPNGDISREQAMTILSRALNKKGYEGISQTKTFSDDSSISEWAKEAVYTLAGAGVVSGKGNNMFCPKDNLTRAEAAKIIYFSLNLTEEVN